VLLSVAAHRAVGFHHASLTDAWHRGQQRWSRLSTAARVVTVADTGHYIQLDHPDVVTDEITRLLP